MSDVTFWSDFDRINATHFWSKHRKILFKPDIEFGTGQRKGLELTWKANQIFKSNRIIFRPELSFRSVVMADGNGTLINSDPNAHAYCICKHLGILYNTRAQNFF